MKYEVYVRTDNMGVTYLEEFSSIEEAENDAVMAYSDSRVQGEDDPINRENVTVERNGITYWQNGVRRIPEEWAEN